MHGGLDLPSGATLAFFPVPFYNRTTSPQHPCLRPREGRREMDPKELLQRYRQTEREFVLVSLRGAALSGADLYHVNLSGADLREADLRGANLTGARLRRADLGWADLRRAQLAGADLGLADLFQAHLDGADLSYANLERSNATGHQLSLASSLHGAILPDGSVHD